MKKGKFDSSYAKLNKEQSMAVLHIDGPLMVVAGPGTGKSTLLTLRIAHILRTTDAPASSILAITFTDSGVASLRDKLFELMGHEGDDVQVHTFHSFCISKINQFPHLFTDILPITVLDDFSSRELMSEILETAKYLEIRPVGNPDYYIAGLLSYVRDAKKEALSPKLLKQWLRTFAKTSPKNEIIDKKIARSLLAVDVYSEYESKKEEIRKIDFDDIIIKFLDSVATNSEFRAAVREGVMYAMVDEHQDTNALQNLVVRSLFGEDESPNIAVVGDEKQAIFRFQGASEKNFIDVKNIWPETKVVSLKTNYRSHSTILRASHKLMVSTISKLVTSLGLNKELVSGTTITEKPLEIVSANETRDMDLFLIDYVRSNLVKEDVKTIAIIARRNAEVRRLTSIFRSAGIEPVGNYDEEVFSHPLVSAILDFCEYALYPDRVHVLARLVASGAVECRNSDMVKVLALLKSGSDASRMLNLDVLQNFHFDNNPIQRLIDLVKKTPLGKLLIKPEYSDVFHEFITIATNVTKGASQQTTVFVCKLLLSMRHSQYRHKKKIDFGSETNGLSIMTAHASKGLEFDHVIIVEATEEEWIGRKKTPPFLLPDNDKDDERIADERRLFFVALTRARSHVVVCHVLQESSKRRPLRFIEDIPSKYLTRRVLETQAGVELETKLDANNVGLDKILKDRIMNSLKTKGLSVTSLNHYLNCPNKFLYLSILKLPQAPVASAVNGSAVHDILSRVMLNEPLSQKETQKLLTNEYNSYITNTLLPAVEKKALVASFQKHVVDIANFVIAEQGLDGEVKTELRLRFDYESRRGSQKTTIPLHGIIDLVRTNGEVVTVTDYKSQTPVSLNQIKGLTKNSNGDYWRQLCFYYYLITSTNLIDTEGKSVETGLLFLKNGKGGILKRVSVVMEEGVANHVLKDVDSLLADVVNGKIGFSFCDNASCDWCRLRKLDFDINK